MTAEVKTNVVEAKNAAGSVPEVKPSVAGKAAEGSDLPKNGEHADSKPQMLELDENAPDSGDNFFTTADHVPGPDAGEMQQELGNDVSPFGGELSAGGLGAPVDSGDSLMYGGVLAPAYGVLSPGEEALADIHAFEPQFMDTPPQPDAKSEAEIPPGVIGEVDDILVGLVDFEVPEVPDVVEPVSVRPEILEIPIVEPIPTPPTPDPEPTPEPPAPPVPSDTIYGTPNADDLDGYDRSTTIFGRAGNDTLTGKDNNDTLYGEDGADTLIGGKGDNYLDGGTSSSDGKTDIDWISYASSSSSVEASFVDGTVTGDDGTDTFVNVEGIIGSSHRDVLVGDDGDNWFNAMGNDSFVLGVSSTYENVTGGNGSDWLSAEGCADALYVELKSNLAAMFTPDVTPSTYKNVMMLNSIENAMGSSHGDSLIGSDGNNILKGEAGNDIVYGEGGNDTLYGGAGDDVVFSKSGDSFLYGGADNDSLIGGNGNNTIDGGTGTDSLFYVYQGTPVTSDGVDLVVADGTATHGAYTDKFSGIEIFHGSKFNDTMTGDTGDDVFYGEDGNDTLIGGAGNDTLYGDRGNDTLNGGADSDFFGVGSGADSVIGGEGNDTLSYARATDGAGVTVRMDTTPLDDSTRVGTTSHDGVTDTFSGIENVVGSNSNDTFIADGIESSFDGGVGSDTLSYAEYQGVSGSLEIDVNDGQVDDIINNVKIGHFSNMEVFIGSNGNDSFISSGANSTAAAGSFDHTFIGGQGSDTFKLLPDGADPGCTNKTLLAYNNTNEGGDTVNDFVSGQDGFMFKAVSQGGNFADNSTNNFQTIGGAYDGTNGGLGGSAGFVFDGGDKLWYDADGDGGGAAVLIANVDGSVDGGDLSMN